MTDDIVARLRDGECGLEYAAADLIEELEKYKSIHAQCDNASLEVEQQLVLRLKRAYARIDELETALKHCIIERDEWLEEARAALAKEKTND